MSSYRKILNETGASMLLALTAAAVLGGIVFYFMKSNSDMISAKNIAEESLELQKEYYSATDTLYYAFKQEEQKYLTALASCGNVRPFIEALKLGSGCNKDVEVFKTGSGTFYTFGGGCEIEENSSDCNDNPFILEIETTHAGKQNLGPFVNFEFKFWIHRISPEKSMVDFLVEIIPAGSRMSFRGGKKRTFSIKSGLRNIAHIESDNRVTEENPSPLNRCSGSPWQDLELFNPLTLKCETFRILGGVNGLAFYNGRYFGFRSSDGQVFDMLSTTTTGPIAVMENGTLSSNKIFPAYSKEYLFNTNDITLIEDTIYYVSGGGEGAHIGLLDMTKATPERRIVCKIGEMGWAQNYEGILALDRSQDLLDLTQKGATATFYLKSSGGDLITVLAIIKDDSTYDCIGLKDKNIQEIEYKRTYGFDRTEDETPIFYF